MAHLGHVETETIKILFAGICFEERPWVSTSLLCSLSPKHFPFWPADRSASVFIFLTLKGLLRREPQGGLSCAEALPAVPASAAMPGGRYLSKSRRSLFVRFIHFLLLPFQIAGSFKLI